jgi:hypothetical protein
MNNPVKWQRAADALGMDVKIDPEKVHRMFDGFVFKNECGAECKNGKPCGVWVPKGEKCWRHE